MYNLNKVEFEIFKICDYYCYYYKRRKLKGERKWCEFRQKFVIFIIIFSYSSSTIFK